MRNSYEVTRHDTFDPPLIQVGGTAFCAEDLFEFVGKEGYVCSFQFRAGTETHSAYGKSITGTIAYSPKQRAALMKQDIDASADEWTRARILCVIPDDLQQVLIDDLRYGGVSIADIEEIHFLPYVRPLENNPDGTKKVPNIIYIDLPDNVRDADVDVLFQNLTVMRLNAGEELAPFEKEQLVGVMLEMRGGKIDSRLLTTFGFTQAEASTNANINHRRLEMRKRRGQLTDEQDEMLKDLSRDRWIERAKLLMQELLRSDLKDATSGNEAIALINRSIDDFEPHVFLTGKKAIYWDYEGYLHIAMRHVKEMQVGTFKSKTPFPYKAEDLQLLVRQVLKQVEDEIHQHFEAPPPHKAYFRVGPMAIYFNGDYYHLRIDEAGRLMQFHSVGESRNAVEQGAASNT